MARVGGVTPSWAESAEQDGDLEQEEEGDAGQSQCQRPGRALPGGSAEAPACALLRGRAGCSPIPALGREPGDAPGAGDTLVIHSHRCHRCHRPAGLPLHRVPARRDIAEVAEQGDVGRGLPRLLRVDGHQDGELRLSGIGDDQPGPGPEAGADGGEEAAVINAGVLPPHGADAPALLQQPQPVLFVDRGQPVKIACETSEDMESRSSVHWYRRGEVGPVLVLKCKDRTREEFSCELERRKSTLHIGSAQPEHAGIYSCAYVRTWHLEFGSGTTLLVGAPQAPQALPSLFCVVGATAGPVVFSWPGGSRVVLGPRGSVGPLLSPMGTSEGGQWLCEVWFSASGTPVRRRMKLHRGTDSCMSPGTWVLVGLGLLLLLSLCLSVCCLQRPTATALPPPGHQLHTLMPARLQEEEAQLTYAHLDFSTPARPRP